MKTLVDLKALAASVWKRLAPTNPDVCGVIILWNRDMPKTPLAIFGETEAQRDVPRVLRELADKIEKEKAHGLLS